MPITDEAHDPRIRQDAGQGFNVILDPGSQLQSLRFKFIHAFEG